MSKIIVAIGGGENGRILSDGTKAPYNTKLIDQEIVKLTNKERPNFLFLAHAINSFEVQKSYFEVMVNIYGNLFNCNCMTVYTFELNDIEKVKEKIEWADIIYEGGGNTLEMINLWKQTGFDKVLYDAWQNGKVICGVSAGAACWFTSCNSDSFENKFESIRCLNWLNAHFTPHVDESGRYESTKKQLKENNLVGIMLSNCSALEIIDDKCKLITENNNSYGIKAYWNDNLYEENKIIPNECFDLDDLMNNKKK